LNKTIPEATRIDAAKTNSTVFEPVSASLAPGDFGDSGDSVEAGAGFFVHFAYKVKSLSGMVSFVKFQLVANVVSVYQPAKV